MKPSDLDLLNSVSAPALHPDGSCCVVSVTRPDFSSDAYTGQLWTVPLDPARQPRRLTRGFNDSQPRYSPDGRVLGFLRAAAGSSAQLYAVNAAGGEPVQLTDAKLGVSWFSFSPDGSTLVFSARVPGQGRHGTVDGVSAGAEDPRLITTLQYRMNGLGYTADKRLQIFTVPLPDLAAEPHIEAVGRAREAADRMDDTPTGGVPRARQLTTADADHSTPVFSADGSRILFSASLHSGADTDLVSDIYSIPAEGGEPQRLTNTTGGPLVGASDPLESADGQWLYFLGQDLSTSGTDFVARNTGLFAVPTDDPAAVVRLTDAESINLGGALVRDGGRGVLAVNSRRGSGELVRFGPDGAAQTLVEGPLVVTGAASAAGAVVVSYTDPRTSGDVAVVRDGGLHPLTDFSAALRAGTRVAEPVEVTFPSRDGYPVHGWMVLPEGPGPHPVLLTIHGGPFAEYSWGYFDEAQVYARAGYAVLLCNPRGSAGYGQAHGAAIREAMGTLDLDDVLSFLEGATESNPELDATRVGVMGGSYGGYLTAWTISQDHRFTAAIVERGFLDPLSFIGSADIGWFFSAAYTGSDPAAVAAQSPFAQIDKVETPTFVIHSEQDLRCPLEQAQRYYTALKLRGVPTEMLLFPGENHELSRSGSPWHRRQRFEHILRWWAKWLPTPENQPDAELLAAGAQD